jgi:hypothetical protein
MPNTGNYMTIQTMQERQVRKERAALPLLAVASASNRVGVRPYAIGPGSHAPAREETLPAGVVGSEQPVRQHGSRMRPACGDMAGASSKEEWLALVSWGRVERGLREEPCRAHDRGDNHDARAFSGFANRTPRGRSRASVVW